MYYCKPIPPSFGLPLSARDHGRQHMWVEPETVYPGRTESRADDIYHTTPSSPATERAQTTAVRRHQSPDRGVGHREGKGQQGSPKHSSHRDHMLPRSNGVEDYERCITGGKEAGSTATGTCCWESDAIMQAYRTAAAGTVRKLASALFGRELLAVEAAKTSAAERERMLEERAKALFESQVDIYVDTYRYPYRL